MKKHTGEFFEEWNKITHQNQIRIPKWRTGALPGVISDIHRVQIILEDPVDVTNKP